MSQNLSILLRMGGALAGQRDTLGSGHPTCIPMTIPNPGKGFVEVHDLGENATRAGRTPVVSRLSGFG